MTELINGYWVFVIATFAITALVGVGLNILIGLTGQISFGHAGFFAIGAYAAAILLTRYGWPLAAVLPVAAAVAAIAGFLLAIPALRVRGPYLAMVTIAFGLIVENVIVEMRSVTGGQNGIMGIPTLGVRQVAILALVILAAALYAYARLARGPWGHAMRAVRDSDVAAESIGIDPLRVRVAAFAFSAFLAGLAGALFAPLSGFVTPSTFHFGQSILFVLVVLIGGSGRVAGPVLGALVVVLLPEMLSGLAEYRLLMFGVLLLLVLWVAPEGIAGLLPPPRAPREWNVAWGRAGEGDALPQRERRTLEARGLSIAFGGVRALAGLDFTARPGRIHALIGPNGAGKTTALNLLTGYYVPDSGSMTLGGTALPTGRGWRSARAGIARTYQTTRLFGSLTVEANVALASLRGRLGFPLAAQPGALAVKAHARSLLRLVGYDGDPGLEARELPLVDQRLVEIARALAIDPDVVFLDEPGAGLSRADKDRLSDLLRQVARSGIGVVLVEHDMGLVMECADEITVLESGVRIAHGSPAEIRADERVRRSYLGERVAVTPATRARVERPALLEIQRLDAGYAGHPVLRGIELRVREHEAIAVLGANGAGKSTLLRAIAGLHRPVRGQVAAMGEAIEGLPAHRIVQRGVVLVPEGRQVFPELSVLDNLRLGAYLRRGADGLEAVLLRFPKLRERIAQRAGSLSGGEQQMLALARGLMAAPRVLLLDEPSLGLAPRIAAELFADLEELRREGMTLVVVDQMAPMALALSDRVYVLEGGEVAFTGSAAEVAANPALERAYLGTSASPCS